MSFVPYEPALARLLDSQEGEIGRFMEGVAQAVTLRAGQNVNAYFHSAPSLDVGADVDYEMEGSTAAVGIRDAGSKSRRMARAQAEGKVNWLADAIDSVRS